MCDDGRPRNRRTDDVLAVVEYRISVDVCAPYPYQPRRASRCRFCRWSPSPGQRFAWLAHRMVPREQAGCIEVAGKRGHLALSQGSLCNARCTNSRSGHAAANGRIYLRLRAERSLISGYAVRRSRESRSPAGEARNKRDDLFELPDAFFRSSTPSERSQRGLLAQSAQGRDGREA
jgi:hypothetical protein